MRIQLQLRLCIDILVDKEFLDSIIIPIAQVVGIFFTTKLARRNQCICFKQQEFFLFDLSFSFHCLLMRLLIFH